MKTSFGRSYVGMMAMACALAGGLSMSASGVAPVVKTVPWVSGNPLIPHTTFAGRAVTLKGISDQSGAGIEWTWDFGDGSPVATGTVSNPYAIEAVHTYTGPVGTIYTARLTVRNTSTGESGSQAYYVQKVDKTLDAEVNVAIDEGLWYLHKTQRRFLSGAVPVGDWNSSGYASSSWGSVSAANVNAFEVNGHLEGGSADNPYTETVRRGLGRLFEFLGTRNLPLINNGVGNGLNPDSNSNGVGLYITQGYSYYQGGMFMDAIVASGTPNAVVVTGGAGVAGKTYAMVVQDMIDDHAWAQYDGSPGGGWRYNANDYPDNSACQWAVIGMIAGERNWGLTIPGWVKTWNVPWLRYTQHSNGQFGYTDTSAVWGPYATTPSGMVQMVLDGIGRDMVIAGGPNWDKAETFLRDRFGNGGGAANAIKDYYYGLFSFVKSMLLHRVDTDGDGDLDPDPITMLRSSTTGVDPIDWYAAEVSAGAPTDGVARTLVNDQNSAGYWRGHNYSSDQYPFETAWAIMMLHRTLFESGVPVAVAKAIPNPAVVGQVIVLDGSDSYHQDPSRMIVGWEWDTNSDGAYDATGPFVTTTFGALGDYPVHLRVTDDSTPPRRAETVVTVRVTTPPVAPTADANGPYILCPAWQPWFLDGTLSTNPDEGQSEPASPPNPGDTIQEYAWDLDGDGQFDDAFGATPDVTAYFTAKGPGSYLVYLRVTDTTGSSYPSSGMGDLSDVGTAQVFVLSANDPACACVTLTATPDIKAVVLDWTDYPVAAGYNVYRSTISGGPYLWIASTSIGTYTDNPGVLDQEYYYVVRPTAANGDEYCQSNEASAEPLHPAPVTTVTPAKVSNLSRYYYTLAATSQSFGRMQVQMYVGDTASSLVVGPIPNGSLVYLRTGMAVATERPGPGTVARVITVKGSARVWAEDPIGQTSAEVIVP